MSAEDDDDYPGAPSYSPSTWNGSALSRAMSAPSPRGMPVQTSQDLVRILNLPRRAPVAGGTATAEAMIEIQMAKYSRGPRACRCGEIDSRIARGKRKCLKRLKWEQAWALHEMTVVGGLVASAPVGLGKTLLNIIAALSLRDCPVALLLIPSSLRRQICTDYQLIAEHFRVPNFTVHLKGKKIWKSEVQYLPDGRVAPTVHVVPYQFISDERRSAWIEGLRPNAIIADECFPGDTKVRTNEGDLPIRDVVDHRRATHALSFDAETGLDVWRPIVGRLRRPGNKTLVRVTHAEGTIVCTEDHRLWTARGYVQAKKLEPTDNLRVRVVRRDVQAETDHEGVLLQEVRSRRSSEKGQRGARQETRGRTGDSDTRVSLVRATIRGRGVSGHAALQCEVLEAQATSSEELSDVRRGVHHSESQSAALQSEVLGELTGSKTSSGDEPESGARVFGLRNQVPDEILRQVHNTLLQSELRHQSLVEGQAATRLLAATEDQPFRFQQERRDASRRSRKTQGEDVPIAWWEREAHQAPDAFTRGAGLAGGLDGVCGLDYRGDRALPIPPESLQDRHRDSRHQTVHRGRWEQSQDEEVEVSRSSKDRDTQLSRVVSVEVLEQGGAPGDGSSCERDPVYDLTVEDTHTYYADGVLVHNCDALADTESSRTIRVLRYFDQYHATTKFCGWTGSLTDSSVSEFAHLYAMALRHRSPLPTDPEAIEEWSRCLDAVPNPCPAGALTRFLEPHEGMHEIRRAVQRRISDTAGIIMIGGRQVVRTDAGEEVLNDIRERPAPAIPQIVLDALDLARNNLRPDSLVSDDPDEILNDPLEAARVVRQVATGVFYRWKWDGIPRELALRWLAARRAWNSELRYRMLRGEVNLDSEKLCTDAARRAHGDLPRDPRLPEWPAATWPAWRDIKDLCHPKTEAKWLHRFLVEDAAEWACSNRGVMWYQMVEFARELGRITGLKVFGENSNEKEIEDLTGEDTVIMSTKSHGRGLNGLQFIYDHQAVINTLASARMYQQLLGRMRRDGQQSNVVQTDVWLHTRELRATFEQALRRGEYVKDLTTEDQMLIEGWRGFAGPLRDHCGAVAG